MLNWALSHQLKPRFLIKLDQLFVCYEQDPFVYVALFDSLGVLFQHTQAQPFPSVIVRDTD